jgi:biotin transport system substrate-specific component
MHTRALTFKEHAWAVAKEILHIGFFVFLLSLSAHMRVYLPFSPVPVTFQTFVVFVSVVFLGKRSFKALAAYLILGVAGAHVFSSGAGFAYLAGPTGGYIMGFFLAGLALVKLLPLRKSLSWYILSFLIADMIILASGSLWLSMSLKVSLGRALTLGALPFIYGDTLKVVLAALIARLARQ